MHKYIKKHLSMSPKVRDVSIKHHERLACSIKGHERCGNFDKKLKHKLMTGY